MSVNAERLEHNMAKLTVEVPAEDFDKAVKKAYQKNKNRITVAGFRKGHAPQQLIERMYGADIFYEDAANYCINDHYDEAVKESGLDIVTRPVIDVTQMEKGKPFIFTAEAAVRPEVTLGEYRGLEVPKEDLTITDDEVEAELKKEQEKNSRMVDVDDRAAQSGDTVTLDYAGTIDGESFAGGSAENHTLTIGSGSFIPGFEDALVGVSLEEEKDVQATFPEDYHAKDLAGKEAIFKCKIHKIQVKELPELDDDFAKDVSEFDTLSEYREDIRKNLLENRKKTARTQKENHAVDKLIGVCEIDLPDAMIDAQVDAMYMEYTQQLQMQGIPLDLFLSYQGINEAGLKEQMRPQAVKRIKTRLCLEAVAKNEKIEISDERIEEEIKKTAKSYNMEEEKLSEMMTDAERDQLKTDLAVQEAVTLVTDAAVEVDIPKEPEKKEKPEEAADKNDSDEKDAAPEEIVKS